MTLAIIWGICLQIVVVIEIYTRRNLQKQYNNILQSQSDRITELENKLNNN